MKWLDGLKAAIPGLLASPGANIGASQTVLEDAPSSVRQVAIIGAGAAGSSTAFHLSRFAAAENLTLNITLFESTGHIGGRTLTVDAYDNASYPTEVGASIFVSANAILWNATQLFDLPLRDPYDEAADRLTVIWDGSSFVYQTAGSDSWWWDLAKLAWKYKLSPWYAQKLMQRTVATFLKLYEAPYFPFRSLSTRAYELDLAKATGVTGQQFLADNGISAEFAADIVQAATRVNYASNLDGIHGLDTMVSMAPEGAKAVEGGNWRIFDRMVAASGASVRLNTSVSGIALGTKVGAKHPKYLLTTTSAAGAGEAAAGVPFDNVVLAAPFQFAGLKAPADVLQTAIDEVPYVKLHVTLFASPFGINPAFLGLKPGEAAPTTVLTTYSPTTNGTGGLEGVGRTELFSISTLRKVVNPATGREELLYKIFSPMEVTPAFLSRVLGVEVPKGFTGPSSSTPREAAVGSDEESEAVDPVSWYHPHVFHSYPKALPRVTFQDPVVGDGVYYTSGMEGFISTMETNALMGKNVARLIVDEALGRSTGHAVGAEGEGESMDGDEEVIVEDGKGAKAVVDEL